jgi:sugar lactone lactonase YvrE
MNCASISEGRRGADQLICPNIRRELTPVKRLGIEETVVQMISKAQESERTFANGLLFGESPRWRDGALWVSDWGANEVLRFDAAGRREVMARVDSFPMCIEHLPDGRLLIVDSAGKQLLRREPDGTLAQHADLHAFSKLDAFGNDIVVDGRGSSLCENSNAF